MSRLAYLPSRTSATETYPRRATIEDCLLHLGKLDSIRLPLVEQKLRFTLNIGTTMTYGQEGVG